MSDFALDPHKVVHVCLGREPVGVAESLVVQKSVGCVQVLIVRVQIRHGGIQVKQGAACVVDLIQNNNRDLDWVAVLVDFQLDAAVEIVVLQRNSPLVILVSAVAEEVHAILFDRAYVLPKRVEHECLARVDDHCVLGHDTRSNQQDESDDWQSDVHGLAWNNYSKQAKESSRDEETAAPPEALHARGRVHNHLFASQSLIGKPLN